MMADAAGSTRGPGRGRARRRAHPLHVLLWALLLAFACSGSLVVQPARAQPAGGDAALRAEQTFWQSIDKDNEEELTLYLERFPAGFFADIARRRLGELQRRRLERKFEAEAAAQRPPPARPAVQETPPVAGPPDIPGRVYMVGDMITFVTRDALTGVVTGHQNMRFLSEKDGVLSDGSGRFRFDVFGDVLRTPAGEYDRAFPSVPKEVTVGRQWAVSFQFKNPRGAFSPQIWDFEVEAMEEVQVPAGKFDTFRVLGKSTFRDGSMARTTVWIDRASRQRVKVTEIVRRGGSYQISVTRELVSFSREGGGKPQ